MSASESISEIRKSVLARRKTIAEAELKTASERVCQRWIDAWEKLSKEHPGRKSDSALNVALYRAFPGEVGLDLLDQYWQSRGARIHFPWVRDRKASILHMVKAPAPDQRQWQKGAYGIDELSAHEGATLAEEMDLVFVPGVAFGRSGERIGMGAGYYDRYLIQAPQALRVAIALDDQIFPKLPQKSWDQSVHWIMTESLDLRLYEGKGEGPAG